MIGRQDISRRPCTNCGGKGQDPKKRTRPCPRCGTSGQEDFCTNCGGLYPSECANPNVIDATCCGQGNEEPVSAEVRRLQKSRHAILTEAIAMMRSGVEPRSALKQCANDAGIPYGDAMQEFVEWAEANWRLGGSGK